MRRVLFMSLLLLLLYAATAKADPRTRSPVAPKPAAAAGLRLWPVIGGGLNTLTCAWSRDGAAVYATGDKDSAVILAKAISSGDSGAIQRLKDTNTAFEVPNGTAARIVKVWGVDIRADGVTETELLDGKDKGATAWFPAASVKTVAYHRFFMGSLVVAGKAGSKDSIILAESAQAHRELASEAKTSKARFLKSLGRGKGRLAGGAFAAIVIAPPSGGVHGTLEVRVLDGPNKGARGWISADAATAKAEAPGEDPPLSVAEGLLRVGQRLEATSDRAIAIENYRELIKKFPESPEAPAAQDRILALGGRP